MARVGINTYTNKQTQKNPKETMQKSEVLRQPE